MIDVLSSAGPPGTRPEGTWHWLPEQADAPSAADLDRARTEAEALLADHGVTYGAADELEPWRLDPTPVVLGEDDWSGLEAGITQRAELLDAVLQDLYGARRLLTDTLLPPTAVVAHPGFLRAVDGLRLPGGRELVLASTDLARDDDGTWLSLADRTQAPSGAGYTMEGRRVVAQVLASVYRATPIARLGPFFRALRQTLHDVAPPSASAPRIALLTPGPGSDTAFDQAYLASMLGLPLVEASDLVVRDGRLWVRALGGTEPVDVLLRRVDAAWCDPLDLRSGSRLGVPGLVRAVRGGTLSVVNPLGSGVLENPAVLAALPRLARTVLDQDLLLPSAPTWWCGEASSLSHVLAHLDELVVLPLSREQDAVLGWTLDAAAREELAARIAAEPWQWAGQARVGGGAVVEPVGPDEAAGSDEAAGPGAAAGSGEPARPVGPGVGVLRTFAVAHRGTYTVMAGGLARVAHGPVVSSRTGAVAKDVWVLSGSTPDAAPEAPEGVTEVAAARRTRLGVSSRTAENLFWMGRYAERAEDQARDLRVVVDRWDDFHGRPRSAGGRALAVLVTALVDELHDPDAASEQPAPTLREIALDRGLEGSIAASVRGLGQAAAAVRDQLSTDTFGPLARIERALRSERARQRIPEGGLDLGVDHVRAATAGLRPVLDRTLEGLLAVAGTIAEGLVRDVGWHLLDAGRRLERAQHVVASLRRTLVGPDTRTVEAHLVDSVVLAHESSITFRRRYGDHTGVPAVLDLLLLDESNPRSLAFQLDRLAHDLAGIPMRARPTDERDRLLAQVRDLVAELDPAAAAAIDENGRRTRLAELLDSMHWRLLALADEIEAVHFARPVAARALDDPWDAGDEEDVP
ncbi:circularly permuted type 2 ATP-grasp protein [Cellulomonas palmilytica]|uniref:circularly permuted type 2 ATP-grasp protein n=1 Tax=Cellulomonas palmilytica TaxID=2608402 RepID=UPI001F2B0124|nr:circularly permuted type 2 ATP-grasp protein [Cellulomonas palmilytica]UJP40458.1 circularly permuted type 2 ATP-grasp protein [Cellulomonas palmilytica]